jgi:methanogenic corrinoid protein MtbC1
MSISKSPEAGGVCAVSERASRAFAEALPRLLTLVNDKFSVETRLSSRTTPEELHIIQDAHGHFGDMLRAVFEFSLYEIMLDEFRTYASALRSRGFGEDYFRRLVEAWIIAVHAAIEHREARELSRVLEWLARNAGALSAEARPPEVALGGPSQEFLGLALSGKRRDVLAYALERAREGMSPVGIVSDIVLPAMAEVGRLWERNEISVSAEHTATEISRYVLQRAMDELPRETALGLGAVVSCVPGEQHDIGALLTAAHLEAKGWDVTYLGRSTPERDLLDTMGEKEPEVGVFSITMIARLPASRDLFVKIRQISPRTRIIVGGHAAGAAAATLAPYVDAVVGGFQDTHDQALRLVRDNA